jgi:hypothetical protein
MPGMHAHVLRAVRSSLGYTDRIIVGIPEDGRSRRTPCEGLNVEQLTAHLVQKVRFFGGLPAGGATDPEAVPEPDLRGRPMIDPFRSAARRVQSSWLPRHLHEVYDLAPGRRSGTEVVRYFLVEVLGHGWDPRWQPPNQPTRAPRSRKLACEPHTRSATRRCGLPG